ncbi:SH3 domain-containing protein [Nostoc sp. NIES-2111]
MFRVVIAAGLIAAVVPATAGDFRRFTTTQKDARYAGSLPGCASSYQAQQTSDGFVAVKSAPDLKSPRVDKLRGGDIVTVCDVHGDWLAIVYNAQHTGAEARCDHDGQTIDRPNYKPGCFAGWVNRRYMTPFSD